MLVHKLAPFATDMFDSPFETKISKSKCNHGNLTQIRAIIKHIEENKVFHDLYTPTHQLVITGDDNLPTESSHDVIILRPDLSRSHQESKNCYQAHTAGREAGHGVSSVVSDDTGVFSLLLHHFM